MLFFRLFGSKDVDLRTAGEAAAGRKSKLASFLEKSAKASKLTDSCKLQKDKADFEAVRAKLNLNNEKNKNRAGIKLLDEFPVMPASENGDLAKKEKLSKKAAEPEVPDVPIPTPAPTNKPSRFNPIDDERMDEVEDMGNLTAADLRKTQSGKSKKPAQIRKNLGQKRFLRKSLKKSLISIFLTKFYF